MDEPTSALTSREVDQLFALIERLVARGVAIVYITHRLDEVYRIGHRVTVLRDGRHVATPPAVGGHGGRARAADGQPRSRASTFRKRRDRAGRGAAARRGPGPRAARCATSASRCAPAKCSASRGLLGAGRSELARVLAGADRADAGRILVRRPGGVVSHARPTRSRNGIGLLPEDRKAAGPGRRLDRGAQHRAAARPPAGAARDFCRAGAKSALAEPFVNDLRVKAHADAAGPAAERRQPAEGGARQVAGRRRAHLHLRRADARRRRRRQGRDLPPDEPADRRRAPASS